MSDGLNDSIQSLARISAASARLMANMHWCADAVDANEEINHMQANLDHVWKLVNESCPSTTATIT